MKVLIIGNAHHKNKEALESMLKHLNWEYHYGNESDIENFNIIYLPYQPINTSKYSPEKKFIIGPHFSVFPNKKSSIKYKISTKIQYTFNRVIG